jgi:hypothetical protein
VLTSVERRGSLPPRFAHPLPKGACGGHWRGRLPFAPLQTHFRSSRHDARSSRLDEGTVNDSSSCPFGIRSGSRNNAFVDFAEAAARNEEVFRSINERIEEGARQHGVEQLLPFHCECATEACVTTIELPPAEYDRIASHRARFVVVPGHEESSVETVVESHSGYLVVEKTGEARAEIEREHPRPRHQS